MLSYRYKKHTDNIPMEDFDMKAKFYICNHCGNLVTTIHNAGVPLVCCFIVTVKRKDASANIKFSSKNRE